MAPTISGNDHILLEGFTFHYRKPRRGDIVSFRSDGVGSLSPGITYLKRIAGEPQDKLGLTNDMLFVNDVRVVLSEATREVHRPDGARFQYLARNADTITVAKGRYFVLGDNTTNSIDSRCFGCVPESNIQERAWFCYWPPSHIGRVR